MAATLRAQPKRRAITRTVAVSICNGDRPNHLLQEVHELLKQHEDKEQPFVALERGLEKEKLHVQATVRIHVHASVVSDVASGG